MMIYFWSYSTANGEYITFLDGEYSLPRFGKPTCGNLVLLHEAMSLKGKMSWYVMKYFMLALKLTTIFFINLCDKLKSFFMRIYALTVQKYVCALD